MEVTKISETGIKIKSKIATFVLEPMESKNKIAADAVLLFSKTVKKQELPLDGDAVIITGAGEYEIRGIKLSGYGKGETLSYGGKIDGIDVLFLKASQAKIKDLQKECQIVVIEADEALEQSVIAVFNATVAIFYGPQAEASSKALGKEVTPVAKYVITRDKLPGEMEVVLLA